MLEEYIIGKDNRERRDALGESGAFHWKKDNDEWKFKQKKKDTKEHMIKWKVFE